jgi:hypothetical protein
MPVRAEPPPPSNGGARGYDVHHRRMMLQLWEDPANRHLIQASESSIRRWRATHPPAARQEMTGNRSRPRLDGEYLVLLVLFTRAYPHATADQQRVFILTRAQVPWLFSRSDISKALKRLGMTRKRGSTVANQAFTPQNLMRRFHFWTSNFPAGIANIPRRYLIDVDECGLELRDASSTYGHAVKELRVVKKGNYSRDVKLTVILAIEAGDPAIPAGQDGSIEYPRRWIKVSALAGTNAETFHSFIMDDVIGTFEAEGIHHRRTFMWDNLGAHLAGPLYDDVWEQGHQCIARPPYRPEDAPIEFIFQQLSAEIRRKWSVIHNQNDLLREIHTVAATRLFGFDNTFEACGYNALL